jgi:hypothetical protein
MTRYDWSKLDAGWRYMHLTQSLMDSKDWTYIVNHLESLSEHPVDALMGSKAYSVDWSAAQDQLAKCRIAEHVDVDTRDWEYAQALLLELSDLIRESHHLAFALKLSIIVERLKKLGWTEAK